jgi:hypothetical protein
MSTVSNLDFENENRCFGVTLFEFDVLDIGLGTGYGSGHGREHTHAVGDLDP